ncbi:hypothetical protein F5883DRAFT_194346 [Diaporthe sp. PMI_573]|nr:hypothetical protein F5883DRAFT_194346 [Diaporthaceae sp. PMI_573]
MGWCCAGGCGCGCVGVSMWVSGMWCVRCAESCRGRGVAKERKQRVFSLSPWGRCKQCNLAKFGRGPMQNSQSVEKFPLGGFGAGTPFLIVGNSLARPRRSLESSSQEHQQASRGCRSCQSAGTVRCGTVRVRYGTAQHSTAQYPLPLPARVGGFGTAST